MDYEDWHTAVTTMLGITDANGLTLWSEVEPRCIEYAEYRIYREPTLDFLVTRTADVSQITTAGQRDVPIPTEILIIEDVNIITPSNTYPLSQQTPNGSGVRIPMYRTSMSVLNAMFPTGTILATPQAYQNYYAILDSQPNWQTNSIHIGPTPDAQYVVEFLGVFRPAALNSTTNTTTFLTTWLPDLFLAASLIWGFSYQRDFGRASDDPATAQSWEAQYKNLLIGASSEEFRKKALSAQATPYVPTPLTKQNRGES